MNSLTESLFCSVITAGSILTKRLKYFRKTRLMSDFSSTKDGACRKNPQMINLRFKKDRLVLEPRGSEKKREELKKKTNSGRKSRVLDCVVLNFL